MYYNYSIKPDFCKNYYELYEDYDKIMASSEVVMKKYTLLGLLLLVLTGCQKDNFEELKKTKIKGCSSETFEESINMYLKDTSWEENNGSYIIKGTNSNKEPVILNVAIKDGNVEIKKILVDKVNVTEGLNSYMSNMCTNYSLPQQNTEKVDEETPKEDTENNNVPVPPAINTQDIVTNISSAPSSSDKIVDTPEPELKPIVPNSSSSEKDPKSTMAACGVSYLDEDDFLYTRTIQMFGDETYKIQRIVMTLKIDFKQELTDDLFNAFKEELEEIPKIKGVTKSINREGTTAIIFKYELHVDEINTDNTNEVKMIRELFEGIDYTYYTIKENVVALRYNGYKCGITD